MYGVRVPVADLQQFELIIGLEAWRAAEPPAEWDPAGSDPEHQLPKFESNLEVTLNAVYVLEHEIFATDNGVTPKKVGTIRCLPGEPLLLLSAAYGMCLVEALTPPPRPRFLVSKSLLEPLIRPHEILIQVDTPEAGREHLPFGLVTRVVTWPIKGLLVEEILPNSWVSGWNSICKRLYPRDRILPRDLITAVDDYTTGQLEEMAKALAGISPRSCGSSLRVTRASSTLLGFRLQELGLPASVSNMIGYMHGDFDALEYGKLPDDDEFNLEAEGEEVEPQEYGQDEVVMVGCAAEAEERAVEAGSGELDSISSPSLLQTKEPGPSMTMPDIEGPPASDDEADPATTKRASQGSGPDEVDLAPLDESSPGDKAAADEEETAKAGSSELDGSSWPAPPQTEELGPATSMPDTEGSPASDNEADPAKTKPASEGTETEEVQEAADDASSPAPVHQPAAEEEKAGEGSSGELDGGSWLTPPETQGEPGPSTTLPDLAGSPASQDEANPTTTLPDAPVSGPEEVQVAAGDASSSQQQAAQEEEEPLQTSSGELDEQDSSSSPPSQDEADPTTTTPAPPGSGTEEVQVAAPDASSPVHQAAAEEEEAVKASSSELDGGSLLTPSQTAEEPGPSTTMPDLEGSPRSHDEADTTTTMPAPPGTEGVENP